MAHNENPTIQDVLGWQRDWSVGSDVTELIQAGIGGADATEIKRLEDLIISGKGHGQENMLHYLNSLLDKSGAYKDTLTGYKGTGEKRGHPFPLEDYVDGKLKGLAMQYKTGDEFGGGYTKELLDIGDISQLFKDPDFMDLSGADLKQSIMDVYQPEFDRLKDEGGYTSNIGIAREGSNLPWFSQDPQYGFEAQNLEELYDLSPEERNKALYGQYETFFKGLSDPESEFYDEGAEDYWKGHGKTEMLEEQDFISALTEGGDITPSYTDIGFESGDLDELISYVQSLREGIGAVPTGESWGLGGKLEDIETGTKREAESLLSSYIPSERTSRYSQLQGKGSPVSGESAESEYLSKLFSGQRGASRDVRDVYSEYGEDVFGTIGDWLGDVG